MSIHLFYYIRSDGVKLFTLSGERMAILFLVVKELTSRLAAEMERERSCCTAIECQNGISLLVSARVKDLMKSMQKFYEKINHLSIYVYTYVYI